MSYSACSVCKLNMYTYLLLKLLVENENIGFNQWITNKLLTQQSVAQFDIHNLHQLVMNLWFFTTQLIKNLFYYLYAISLKILNLPYNF